MPLQNINFSMMKNESLSNLTPVPCMLMRGGTSRGPFFLESDLPSEPAARNRVLLAAMGSPDNRQIDGLGGAHPLTSKVGIVRLSTKPGIQLDFQFAQLQPNSDSVDYTANCGNMLAAVLPFALESNLLPCEKGETTARILTLNTGMQCDVTVQTPHGQINYAGNTQIDGVSGTASPIRISFLDTAGSICPSLLPTGQPRDRVSVNDGIESPFSIDVTLIDNGMPMVLIRAMDFGLSGYESVEELNGNLPMRAKLEALRLQVGPLMGLGDVTTKNYPKMCLVAPAGEGGNISTRCFIPHVCHEAIGVLAAVTIATACVMKGSITEGIATVRDELKQTLSIEHPTGEISVELELDSQDRQQVTGAALIRTARLIMRGEVMIPKEILQG